jgi:hypothetical protein
MPGHAGIRHHGIAAARLVEARSGRLSHLIGMRDEPNVSGLERMLSTRELAEHLGVAPQAIYDLPL